MQWTLPSNILHTSPQPKPAPAEAFAAKAFHAQDKVDAKAQVIFDTCWRRLESKLKGVSIIRANLCTL